LAARIAISNCIPTTKSFSETMTEMFELWNQEMDNAPLIAEDVKYSGNAEFWFTYHITTEIFNYDYFGFKTLERSYCLR
jgi:ribonucleoside-diphosphate reductase alpha chain